MTKLLTIPISIVIILSISGCNITGAVNAFIDNHNEREELKQQAEEIVECFKTNDISTFEEMFCEEARNNNDLPLEIQNVFDCVKGEIISYEYLDFGLVGSVQDGKYDKKEYNILLTVTTDKNEHYEIVFTRFFVNDFNPESIGIYQLSVGLMAQKEINGKIRQIKEFLYGIYPYDVNDEK